MLDKNELSRRRFLGQASCAGLGYLTFVNQLLNLKAMGSAAISNSDVGGGDDYKAIVCILLAGGNDSYNMLVPYDTNSHDEYVIARSGLYDAAGGSGLAIPRSELAGTILNTNIGGKQWAVHPSMTGVQSLYDSGRAAFLTNVGTLVKPTTRAQYENDVNNNPLGLFSHADQIQQWQTGLPHERSAKGWGGKIADLIGDCNTNDQISMNVSLSGSNIFQSGRTTIEYAIDPYRGAIGIDGYEPASDWMVREASTKAIENMLTDTYADIFKKTYVNTAKSALDGYLQFTDALANAVTFPEGTFPDSYFGASMEMIARTISIREDLGFKRQIYFVTVGGWDHHDEVINNQQAMLGMVSEAITSFQNALGTMTGEVEDKVLTMFISEFGRTLRSNGNGSDHAWGGNTMVFGGSNLLNGGQIYGSYPSLALGAGNPIELGLGRFIPSLATDLYYAEVAKWFGVTDNGPQSDLKTIFPNLANFPYLGGSKPVGFLSGNF